MDQWVDNQLSSLAPNWEPRTEFALQELLRRKTSADPQRWTRFGMTATILATTAVVLVMLPWQKMWTPKETPPAPKPAVAVIAKQQQSEPAKAAEKTPETPAKQQTQTPPEPSKGQANTVVNLRQENTLENLPNSEAELLHYLQQLSVSKSIETQTPAGATQPTLIKSVTPEYSEAAKQARVKGSIEIEITINTDGTVHFERFVNTLGFGLDEKAREAVEKFQFTPATKDGIAVPTLSRVKVEFTLR